MKKLNISPHLQLPADTVTATIVVYGGKGMGKTNMASVMAEELSQARLHFALIDPLGVSWGLQSSADGVSGGIAVLVLGGVHGDLPIDPNAGQIVADLVVDESVNVVIDISRHASGKPWSMGEKVRFVTDYSLRIYERQSEQRVPLMQIYDEAGKFVPQMIPHGALEIAKCVGAIEQLVEWGRNVGIGVMLITQRSARMNKSVSELADLMVAFRTVGPHSLKAIDDWLSENVAKAERMQILEDIRALPVGSAMFVSPGWLKFQGIVPLRKRHTFDSSATPKPGVAQRAPAGRAAIDTEQYRKRLAAVIERAATDDPKALKARIAALERAARDATPRVERVEVKVPVITDKQVTSLKDIARSLTEMSAHAAAIADEVLGSLKAFSQPASPVVRAVPASPVQGGFEIPAAARVTGVSFKLANDDRHVLSPAMLRILGAVAFLHKRGVELPLKAQVALLSDHTPTSGGFAKSISVLHAAGLVQYPRAGRVQMTDEGWRLANRAIEASSESLQKQVLAKLNPAKARILQALIDVYPNALPKAVLAERIGRTVTSGGLAKHIGELRGSGLIRYPSPGSAVAEDVLFLGQARHNEAKERQ